MLKVNEEKVRENPTLAVIECSDLLSLCYAGIDASVRGGQQLNIDGVEVDGVQMGAASVAAYCSSVLSFLAGEGLLDGD